MLYRTMSRIAVFCLALALIAVSDSAAIAGNTVKVFILAGQSNMEGKASNELFDHQATDPKTKDFFAHLRDGDKWVVRDDVFINYLGRRGKLSLGYGSKGRTGAEYEFGYIMGEHFREPVLLIKAAWGGHSLYEHFRPPSAGLPGGSGPEAAKKYGVSYRNMMAEVDKIKANYASMFPELRGGKLEFAGFFWFQGYNDQKGAAAKEYAQNMKLFIEDVRKDLDVPNLPFVIAAIGTFASRPEMANTNAVYQAQMAMNKVPAFKGNVKAFATHPLVDKAAMELYPTWQKNGEQWKVTGSERPYHYYGSAIWYTRIGHAAGKAMIELIENQK